MKKNLFNKMFNPTRTKVFWLYFVVAALVIIGGVILMPVWQNAGDWCFFRTWGLDIVNIMISMCIFVYLFTFLIKKITTRSNGVVKVLTIIEFVLLLIIGMFSLLEQFDIFNLNCCQILGLVFYSRGVVEIFRAYYHQKGENSKYPLWWLIIAILFVTLGAYLFIASPFDEIVVLWTVVGFILLVGLCLVVIGFRAKPLLTPEQKAKKKQTKKEKEAKKKQKQLEKKAKAKEKEAAKKAKEASKAKTKSEKAKENSK